MAELEKVSKALECCEKLWGHSGICDGCPYKAENDICCTCEENAQMLRDARELLEGLRARVMTKEEIIGWDGYIWFEFSGMRVMKVVLIDHGIVREPFRGDYPTKELTWETCQEKWRAWTSRPTDEQREAEKWEERCT